MNPPLMSSRNEHSNRPAISPTGALILFWRDMPPAQPSQIKARFAPGFALQRRTRIDELAARYRLLLQSNFITGQHLAVDGGSMLGN